MELEGSGRAAGTGIMSDGDRIVRLKIELDDWDPAIWRRVEVPLTMTLRGLHDVVQAAMPFQDYHLFEFRADDKRYAIPDPEWDSFGDKTWSAKTTRLATLIDRGVSQLAYTYDFGDDWRHTITVEQIGEADPATEYPRFIEGEGRAPPEDVGGLPGFELFLDAIADPDHEEHDDLMRWSGGSFDPETLDADAVQKRVAKLARRRTIGKAAFAKSRNRIN